MSILLIGDPHFKNDNSIECEQLLQETIRVIKEKKCINFVVIMGDIIYSLRDTNRWRRKNNKDRIIRGVKFYS